MQISRHWRLNGLRYRLQGVRYENGDTSVQERPLPEATSEVQNSIHDVKSDTSKAEAVA
jgi:hypothetical protein